MIHYKHGWCPLAIYTSWIQLELIQIQSLFFYPADLVELALPEGFGLDTGTVSGSSDAFRHVSVVVHVVFDDFVDSARCQRDMTQLLIFSL